MKKSVRIRKAGPGETPGYYNKTAKFLDKALPKAKVGMQVGNGLQDKLQVIMLDTYSSVRDGNDPQEVFRKLLMEYGMPQEMAYKIMQTVMQKLAQDGYADPASLQEDEEDQVAQAPQEQSEPSAPMMQNQNPGTPDEDEQLALSEAEGDTGYDAMDYYNDRSMEEQEQQELSKYGGPLRRKLKRAQQGMQQPSQEEMMMMQQGQGQPEQQQGGGDQMQQIMQQVGQALEQGAKPEDIIAQLLQGQIPPEAIMQIFVQFGMGEEQVGQVIQSVMQQLQGGQEQMMMYGGSYNDGGEYDNYFDEEQTPEDTVINQYSNPGQLSMEQKAPMSVEAMLQSFNLPSSDMQTPDLNAYLQSVYNYRNVGSDDIPNDLLPMSQAMYGGSYARGGVTGPGKKGRRKKNKETTTPVETTVEAPRVEPTIRIEPQEAAATKANILQNLQNAYYTKNALAPKRGVMGTAAQVLGTGINYIRPENWAESSKAFGLIGGREGVEPATTATKTYEDIYKILRNKEYKPETLQKNEDGTYSSGLAFNMGPQLYEMLSKDVLLNHSVQTGLKNHGSVQLEFPTSKVPELNFLSLHNEKSNTKIKLVKDSDGALKIQLITDVKTPLKGVDKNTLTIKDEFFFDPATESLIDTKTGMPLEMIQKSYYKGNELNWYNQSGTFPFTKKYKSGLDISKYPEVVSSEPLKQTPGSRWNAAWNMIGKPALFTPYVLPFTYPGFAARNKFYPESNKVTVDYFGRQRELGPQAPGGMTFGDQPFGTQYADYNLQANRNYLTGRNFMIGAGLLGAGLGAGYLYYNRNTGDMEVGTEGAQRRPFQPYIKDNFSGAGRSFDTTGFGINIPITRKDSMYVSPSGDTIHDKGWGAPKDADFKHGGAHKKKFLKRMQQMFEPGGEAQDTSLGKGSRLDNLDRDVAKKKEWVPFLKRQSDKAANEELYKLVQKSGDPQLMNIFMGDDQSNQGMQQPMSNNQMAEGEEGGFVNMDMNNPLTRFVYGGYDEAPDYYESNMLPEASDGIEITNRAGQNRMVADVMPFEEWAEGEKDDFATTHPGIDFETWKAGDEAGDDYQDYASFHHKSLNEYQDFGAPVSAPSLNFNPTTTNTNNCGPGTVWIEAYGQCVPIMKTKYNARMVSGEPGLQNIILPWNPIFKTRGYKTKYGDRLTLKDLQKYAGKELGNPYATLTYRKNMLSPKRQLDIWNPDGKLSEADMKALMDYGVGKGWNKKGSKNKSNSSANKEEKTKRENKKEGPREVKFSSAAAKYRLQQGFDKAFGAPIDYYKNLGKKIIKPFTKKK